MSAKKKNKNNAGAADNSTGQSPQSATPQPSQRSAVQTQYQQPPQGYRPPKQSYQRPQKNSGNKQLRRILRSRLTPVAIVVLLAVLASAYFYHAGKQAQQQPNNPTSASLQTTAEVVKQVSRHILLPSGEQPTVATVSDASKVRNQAFFANAASGDKVLIYAQAKKAYLYRPSIDRIVEVAPLAPSKTGS